MIKLILIIILVLILFYFIYHNNCERFTTKKVDNITILNDLYIDNNVNLNDKSINSNRICIFKKIHEKENIIPIFHKQQPTSQATQTEATSSIILHDTYNKGVYSTDSYTITNYSGNNIRIKYKYSLNNCEPKSITMELYKNTDKDNDKDILSKLIKTTTNIKPNIKTKIFTETIYKDISTFVKNGDEITLKFYIPDCKDKDKDKTSITLDSAELIYNTNENDNYDIDIECINADELLSSLKTHSRKKVVCLDGECINSNDIQLLNGEGSFKLQNKSQKTDFKGRCIGDNNDIKLRRCGRDTRSDSTEGYDFFDSWYNRMNIKALQSIPCDDMRSYNYKLEKGENSDKNLKRNDKKLDVSSSQKIIAGLGSHK